MGSFGENKPRTAHFRRAAGHKAGNAPQQKTEAELQAECDRWNEQHRVGTLVDYFRVIAPREDLEGRYMTRTKAQVLGGHTAVLWLHGKSGCVALEAVVPVESEQ